MSYTVYALKWRPQNFDDIVGQNHIVTTLKSAIANNRVAHAYLFSGPRGVGKTSCARILAKALNCKEGPSEKPCQKCSSCLEISQGRSFDVIEIDGASNNSVDNIRDLRESVKFAPSQGRFKIYIIDEVHMLSDSAFNALLKTLEEPPPYVKFIFATTHPQKVIPTILSRCHRLDFRRIPALEMVEQLGKIVAQEKLSVEKEVLFAIAKSSDGSLRDAESILDQLVSFTKDKVSLKDVISMLGIVEQEALLEITDKIIQKDALSALALLNKLIDDGKDVGVFLVNLIEHFRNLMIAKVTKGDSKLIDLPQETCERLLKQSNAFTLEEIFSAFNILVSTQEMTKKLESLRIPLEITLVRLANEKKGSSVDARQVQPEKVLPKQTPPPAARVTPAKVEVKKIIPPIKPPEPTHSITIDNVKDAWNSLIDSLGKIKISVASYLNEGQPFKLNGNILVVSFPKNFSLHKEALERKDNRALVEKSLFDIFSVNLRTDFILSEEQKHKENDENHPFLRSALDLFNGRVINKDE
ncbi:MAG: DNA polymerase III subunit gamma/tau [Candidatus Omnitrophica bacterium]|nr:DNA polymerase III subunit gamma/tau [Candidatus Omnitrophota bacterium]